MPNSNQNQRRGYSNPNGFDKEAEINNIVSEFKTIWISDKVDEDMINFTEKAGKTMKQKGLTTSQIRNVYGEIKRIQVAGFEKEKTSFFLLKPKMAYALGRDSKNLGLKLFKNIFDKCYAFVKDEKSYKNFCYLIEALIAYHKSFGGK